MKSRWINKFASTNNLSRNNIRFIQSEFFVNLKLLSQLTLINASVFLTSCGGGSGGASSSSSTPTVPSSEARWKLGVYEDESLFKDSCATPRSGVSSITGEAFIDAAGDALDEKLWLRSWTNNTYLWYDEVDDNNPADFSTSKYFEQLKTDFRTDSGSFKDNFHFSQSTDEYLTRTQRGLSFGYGISWEFVQASAPRRIIVRYTQPDSPAENAGIERGDELITIDTIDFINTENHDDVDAINEALFPSSTGQVFQFTLQKKSGEQRTYSLTPSNVELSPVRNSTVLSTEIGSVGYVQFDSHIQSAQGPLISAFNLFSQNNVQALILDMRYNGGGLLSMASQLAFMVTGQQQTDGLTFDELKFNDKHPTFDPVTGNRLQPTPFYDREIDYERNVFTSNALPSLGLNTLYILTSGATCSASEAVINGLRGINVEVVIIGDSTCGKPYGFYPTDNCGTTYFTIQFQGSNQKGFGEYSDGFIPSPNPIFEADVQGCLVEDDFSHALGTTEEGILNAAVNHLQSGECPVQAKAKIPVAQSPVSQGPNIQTSDSILDAIILENAINQVISESTY